MCIRLHISFMVADLPWLSVFDFDWEVEYPEPVFSLIRLLLLSEADWKKAQEKSKLPKSKPDAQVLQVLQSAVQRRLNEYPTSIQVGLPCCSCIPSSSDIP